MDLLGVIVILNGAPRSGKSSIARAIQETFDGPWMNLGVDAYVLCVTPERYRPGIGLRPGGERPDLEALVPTFYAALYEAVAAHSRLGLNVVVDVGHHEGYSTPLGIVAGAARRLDGLPAYLVGVQCPLDVIMQRRDAGQERRGSGYVTGTPDDHAPEPVRRWQREVHIPGIYDLEVDTSTSTPEQCAAAIQRRLQDGPPRALGRIAGSAP